MPPFYQVLTTSNSRLKLKLTVVFSTPSGMYLPLDSRHRAARPRYLLSTAPDGALEEAPAAVARGHAVVFARGLVPADATCQLGAPLLHGGTTCRGQRDSRRVRLVVVRPGRIFTASL